MNVDGANRRVEIGSTWYGRDYQRTAVNTESKYLLLRHAFEALGCIRVEFKTDSRSSGSARRIRHSVYYSIVNDEWPAVKRILEEKLGKRET